MIWLKNKLALALTIGRVFLLLYFTSIVRIGLNTDHKELMTKLEDVSSRLLAKQTSTAEPMDTEIPNELPPKAFLNVDQVTPGSPSDLAVSHSGAY